MIQYSDIRYSFVIKGVSVMSANHRREAIIQILRTAGVPVSGTELSQECEVSRQIIVQDISWLRAAGHQILSTTKGTITSSGTKLPPSIKALIFNPNSEPVAAACLSISPVDK
jgi:biotin operon repressor